jgi:hypothetical protein
MIKSSSKLTTAAVGLGAEDNTAIRTPRHSESSTVGGGCRCGGDHAEESQQEEEDGEHCDGVVCKDLRFDRDDMS